MLGSLVIGVIAAIAREKTLAWYFFATGLMGGFTTYSAFSLESVRMFSGLSPDGQSHTPAKPADAMAYIALTTALCLAACWLGLKLVEGVQMLNARR